MTTESKPREFWIREPKEPRKGALTVATEIKEPWLDQAPQSGSHWLRKPAFKVIEKSFADQLQAEIRAKDELLAEARISLESLVHGIMDLGGTSAQQFSAKKKLFDKMSDSILTLQKLREGKNA